MTLRAWTLAIDFGTTATVAAVQIDGDRPEILEIGGERRLPSIVFIDDDGAIVVGQAAAGLAISRPDRAIRAPKGRLGEQVPVVLAGEAHQPVDLVAAVLSSVLAEASRYVGNSPSRTRLTYPATWNRPRRSRLLEAAGKAGLPEPELIAEPVAAALTYSERGQLPDDGYVAVYDLGGGTFDTAVLQATSGGFRVTGRPHGDPQLGGELFDEMLMNLVGERLDEDRWDELIISEEPAWRRAAARLRRECRRVKEALSTHGYGEIVMGLPDGMVEERVTKEELEELVRPFIDESVALLGQCIADAGVSPEDLHAIYITGGASRMPMVEEAVREAYPDVAISRQGDPKTAVAFGALVASPASMDASIAAAPERTTFGEKPQTDREVPPTPSADPKPTVPPTPSQDLRTASFDASSPPTPRPGSGSTAVPPTPSQDLRSPNPGAGSNSAAVPPTPPPSAASVDRSAPAPPPSVDPSLPPAPRIPGPPSLDRQPPQNRPPQGQGPGAQPPGSFDQATPQGFQSSPTPTPQPESRPAQPTAAQPTAQPTVTPAQSSPRSTAPAQTSAGRVEHVEKESWTSKPALLALAGFLGVLIIGGALVAAALAAGGDEGGSGSSTTELSAGTDLDDDSSDDTTTTTEADDDNTGIGSETVTTPPPLSGPTQGDLNNSLLISDDVPSAFIIGTRADDDDAAFCGAAAVAEPVIESGVIFENLAGESLLHEVFSYDSEATARSVFTADMTTIEGCPTSTFESGGVTLDVSASTATVPPLGDESAGFRLILVNPLNPSTEVHIQFANVRHGRSVTSFGLTTVGVPTAEQILLFNETLTLVGGRLVETVPR